MKKYYGKKFDTYVLHYLKIVNRDPSCFNVYEKLGKWNPYDWFTPRGEFKPIYCHVVKLGS
jgi:hypothetical protein